MYSSDESSIIGFVVVCFMFALLVLMAPNCYRSTMKRYDIEGTVSGEIGMKQRFNQEGGETKYSVNLVDITAPSRPSEFRSDESIVNCNATQCATLRPEQRVRLNCYAEFHWIEPDEEECRFTKIISTPHS